jgi:hypothetical protein
MSEQIPEPQSPGTQDDEATEPSQAQIVIDFLEAATQTPLPLARSLLLRAATANTAEQTARNAENTFRNRPGMCLQQSRIWAGISAKYPDATTAWLHTHDRHSGDRRVPRGAMAFWIGGSDGHGHVAPGVGGAGSPVRSTDAGGTGIVATRTLAWFDENWPGLHYIGWAWDLNDVTIPHQEEDWFDMATEAELRKIVAEEVAKNNDDAAKVFWDKMIEVTDNAGKTVLKPAKQLLRQIWQRSDD